MRVIGFRCDGCGKERLFNQDDLAPMSDRLRQISLFESVPGDWYSVFQGPIDGRKEPLLFCSKECLRHHPLKRMEEER